MRKKEPSSFTDSPKRRYTLPKSRILRGRKNFKRLFENSSLITSPTVNLRYAVANIPREEYRVAFIAPKKLGPATERNRSKRLLRESFRLNQYLVTDLFPEPKLGIHCAFLARHANLNFEQVQKDMVTLLTELRNRLLENTSSF